MSVRNRSPNFTVLDVDHMDRLMRGDDERTLLMLAGAGSILYVAAGSAVFAGEPPLLAAGLLFVGLGVGVVVRSAAARLVAMSALGAALLAILYDLVITYRARASALMTVEDAAGWSRRDSWRRPNVPRSVR